MPPALERLPGHIRFDPTGSSISRSLNPRTYRQAVLVLSYMRCGATASTHAELLTILHGKRQTQSSSRSSVSPRFQQFQASGPKILAVESCSATTQSTLAAPIKGLTRATLAAEGRVPRFICRDRSSFKPSGCSYTPTYPSECFPTDWDSGRSIPQVLQAGNELHPEGISQMVSRFLSDRSATTGHMQHVCHSFGRIRGRR